MSPIVLKNETIEKIDLVNKPAVKAISNLPFDLKSWTIQHWSIVIAEMSGLSLAVTNQITYGDMMMIASVAADFLFSPEDQSS
jgi:hypothetical protein